MPLRFSVTVESVARAAQVKHTQNVSPLGLQVVTRWAWQTREPRPSEIGSGRIHNLTERPDKCEERRKHEL